MKNRIFILGLFISIASHAQNGYKISLKTNSTIGEKIVINGYFGSQSNTFPIDTLSIEKPNQTLVFENSKRIYGGIYQIKFLSKSDYIDLVLDNGSAVAATLSGDDIKKISIQKSPENVDFLAYQNSNRTSEEAKKMRETLIKKYPKSVFGLFLKIENLRNVNSKSAEAELVQEKFFSQIDRKDPRLMLLPNTANALYKYVNLKPVNETNYRSAIEALMKDLDEKSPTYGFYLSWVFKNILFFKDNNIEMLYPEFFKKYVMGKDVKFSTKTEYSSIANISMKIDKLPNGAQIPAFEMHDKRDSTFQLAEVVKKSKFTLLAFYDPDCHHCQITMPKFVDFFNTDEMKAYDVQKIAILNAPEDLKKWDEFVDKHKMQTWLNVKSGKLDLKYRDDFMVYANPNFFLVDQTGKILTKDQDLDYIRFIIWKNVKGLN